MNHKTPPRVAKNWTNLIELLLERAGRQLDQPAYTFLGEGGEADSLTYEQLTRQTRRIAAHLQQHQTEGRPVLLLYPQGLAYITAFFGCLYAGAVAVPTALPRLNRANPRLEAIIADSGAELILTTGHFLARFRERPDPALAALHWIATDTLPDEAAGPPALGERLAYLQYTSGSTAAPKGVMISHGNALANSADFARACQTGPESRMVSWLPHFHDFGLVYGIIQPLFGSFPAYLLDPAAFAQQPLRWLEAITRYGGTHTGAPNFAYDLCVEKTTPDQRAGLDLRSWAVAINGAEPVRRETIERFTEAFAPCGFRRSAFMPGYGLAETTLRATTAPKDASPCFCSVEAAALEQNRIVEAEAGRTFVGCGSTQSDMELVIVEPGDRALCPPDRIGEIWIRGASVAGGYWRRPEETARTFGAYLAGGEGPFLRTGDLGFFRYGHLFITGRLKDLIIIRGRNYYPQDIEETAARSHPAIRPGFGAAFGVEANQAEQLVIVQEMRRTALHGLDAEAVIRAIRRAVAEEYEIAPYVIMLTKPNRIPRTSSGKVQRGRCRAMFVAGELAGVVGQWRQTETAEPPDLPLRQRLAARPDLLEAYLQSQLARVMRQPPPDPQTPLNQLGLDSMMAVELQNRIELDLEVVLPLEQFMTDDSLHQLAAYIWERMTHG